MKLLELVKAAKAGDQKKFGNMDDKRAAKVVQAALKEISYRIETMPNDGTVAVAGFGVFRAKAVEKVTDGRKETIKRVVFRQFKAKAPGKAPAAPKAAPASKS